MPLALLLNVEEVQVVQVVILHRSEFFWISLIS
jgi:hypothetical protein